MTASKVKRTGRAAGARRRRTSAEPAASFRASYGPACEAVVIGARRPPPCQHCEDPMRGGLHFCDLNALLRQIREAAQRELAARSGACPTSAQTAPSEGRPR